MKSKYAVIAILAIVAVVGAMTLFPVESDGQQYPSFYTLIVRTTLTNYGSMSTTGAMTQTGAAQFFSNTAFDTTTISVAAYVSGTTLALPAGTFFMFDDTTKITRITSTSAQGRLIFLTAPATANMEDTLVDGVNLKLAGNFNMTPDDAITLVYRDTFWVELDRSAN